MDLLSDITRELARNMGGGRCHVYIALHEDIETFPTKRPDDSTVSMEQLAELYGNFVMKPGKRFYEVRAIEDTVVINSTDQGEIGGMSYLNNIQFSIAGNDSQALGLQERLTNRSVVVIGLDKEGRKRVIGTEHCGAFRQPQNSSTGTTAAERKMVMLAFACNDHGPAPIYPGTIDLESGSGSGA